MCYDVWDAKHTLRELRLMRLMEYHPNVITLIDLNVVEKEDELYIIMELMDADLHKIIQSKQQLSKCHVQVIMKQILLGVNALHDNNVYHRDLKPGNILVGRDCQIRITDFGLARSMGTDCGDETDGKTARNQHEDANDNANNSNLNPASAMTEYVVTRWYRCPELLLAPHVAYTRAVDMWSVGCILAEIVNREPLFPGRSYVHQVQLILETIGTPPSTGAMGFVPRADAASYLERQTAKPGKPWRTTLKCDDADCIDLISRLLIFNPTKRLDASECIGHCYFNGTPDLPCEDEEKTPGGAHLCKPPERVDFDFDHDCIELDELRELIRGEVEIMRKKNVSGKKESDDYCDDHDCSKVSENGSGSDKDKSGVKERTKKQKDDFKKQQQKQQQQQQQQQQQKRKNDTNKDVTPDTDSPDSQVTDVTEDTQPDSAFTTPAASPIERVLQKKASEKKLVKKASWVKQLDKAATESAARKQQPPTSSMVTPVDSAKAKAGIASTSTEGGKMVSLVSSSENGIILKESPAKPKVVSRTRSRLVNAIRDAGGRE
jgi:serine/threonine protein kinase